VEHDDETLKKPDSFEESNVTVNIRPGRENKAAIDRSVVMIGIACGLIAVLAGAEPTGFFWADALYAIVAVTIVVVVGMRAQWWVIALHIAVASALAFSTAGVVVGGILYLFTLFYSSRTRSVPRVKAVVMGASVNLMFYSHWTGVFGASSFVGLATSAVFCVIIAKSESLEVKVARKKVIFVACIFLLSLLGLSIALLMVREPMTKGNRLAREGIAALNQGDISVAREKLDAAQVQLEEASGWFNSPLTYMARLVPVVSQHRDAAAQLSSSFSQSLQELSLGLSQFDLDKLRVVQGKLDLVAMGDLQEPVAQILTEVKDLRGELFAAQSPWLIGKIQDEFASLIEDLDQQIMRGENAQVALTLAPQLFGEDHPVTYFVALTTPVEARGHGGFMGNWIELSIDNGRIQVYEYGRATDLNEAGVRPRKITGPADWIQRYGAFGFTNATGGTVGEHPWQNITMSPHFPSTGQVISELYPQSGGTELDGVFAMDVQTLSVLLEFAGPVSVEGRQEPLTSANAVEFLLHDQYVEFTVDKRIDLLESVTRQAIDQILDGDLPPPNVLANRLGPMVSQGRLTGYSPNPDIEDLFSRIGMSGAMSCEKTADCFAVTVDNASGSKIDYYLDMKVKYSVELQRNSDVAQGTVDITASNSSPTTGLPDYIIGNMVGLPRGSNRMLISIHSRLGYVRSSDPGDGLRWWFSNEQGHNVSSVYVDVPPGQTIHLVVELGGSLDLSNGYTLTARNPAAVRPWATDIELIEDGKKTQLKNSAEAGHWLLP
jgi:hypothetical protein